MRMSHFVIASGAESALPAGTTARPITLLAIQLTLMPCARMTRCTFGQVSGN